jgi:HSP20 family protein
MTNLRDEINRLFEAPFGELLRTSEFSNGWAPALDLSEDKDSLVATVEVPGMKKEDIQVSVHEGVLSVSGERARESESDEAGVHRSERSYGRFQRTLTLPKPVKVSDIKAAYKDGLLTITMPKTEEQAEASCGRCLNPTIHRQGYRPPVDPATRHRERNRP